VAEPSPIACRMDALAAAERARRSEVLAILTQRTVEVVETADGMAGEFVAYESRCCPFIRFELSVEADGGPVRLAFGGREGVREFLRATFLSG
jgi:hypothetical protein